MSHFDNFVDILNSESCLSPINCSHPSIILNSKYYDLYNAGFSVYLSFDQYGKRVNVCLSKFTHKFDKDSLFRYLIDIKSKYVSPMTCYSDFYFEKRGQQFPVFFLFACGKCELCRAKKSSEYSFRAACETFTYPLNPLFVTLTYRPETLPSDGLHLEHLQKFFKRLRFRMSDVFGLSTDFRYLAVGEYGANNGRPHYHIIFWNLPIDVNNYDKSCLRINSLIRYAWTDYLLDENGKRIFSLNKRKKKFYHRRSIGIVDIRPVLNGCPAYITKYFRKEQHNRKNYPGRNFLVSSRGKGGIGSAYIDSQKDFILSEKSVPSVSVLDEQTGRIFSYPVTGYLKNRLFPSLSSAYSKRTPNGDNNYDLCKEISGKLHNLMGLRYWLEEKSERMIMKPLLNTDIQLFLRESQYFFRLDTRNFYLEEYSYLRHYDSSELCERYFTLKADILNLIKKVSFSLLRKSKALYLQKCEIDKRLRQRQRFFYYNIESNIATEIQKYNHYLAKCYF